ncbi:MAG: hypothetical protein SOZ65_05255, partial [Erysipelotrichaceae bacterium]|nr:hypothetical protein [Erysipelotrichaceae bacterium]
ISLMIKISADVISNTYTLMVRNSSLPECCKILSGQKGALLYSPVGGIVRPAELYSPSVEKLHDRECCVTLFRQGGYTLLRR